MNTYEFTWRTPKSKGFAITSAEDEETATKNVVEYFDDVSGCVVTLESTYPIDAVLVTVMERLQ